MRDQRCQSFGNEFRILALEEVEQILKSSPLVLEPLNHCAALLYNHILYY